MTEITIQEISMADEPIDLKYGYSAVTRAKVYIRGTATAAYTLDISTYCPKVKAIEGIIFESVAGAATATESAWSGTTITYANTGAVKQCVLVELNQ